MAWPWIKCSKMCDLYHVIVINAYFFQVIISLGICKTLAEGIGPIVARHKSTLLPNMLSTMADAKVLFIIFISFCTV